MRRLSFNLGEQMDISKLSNEQLDALKEIGTIGAGNAATGLSKMLNKKINITVPSAQILPLEKVPQALGGMDKLVSAIYIVVTGELSGSILLIYPMEEALRLTDMLTGKTPGTTKLLDDFGQSGLKELTNITTGCYLQALSKVVNMKLMHSIPAFATDMLGAIIDGILIKLGLEVEQAVVIETEFIVEQGLTKGYLLFLPDPAGLEVILQKIGLSQ
jgi:chemotaxis protein CheC